MCLWLAVAFCMRHYGSRTGQAPKAIDESSDENHLHRARFQLHGSESIRIYMSIYTFKNIFQALDVTLYCYHTGFNGLNQGSTATINTNYHFRITFLPLVRIQSDDQCCIDPFQIVESLLHVGLFDRPNQCILPLTSRL
jgi:hypothetical protein